MPDTAKPPVMTDVARLAGVSHQTVSRVVNGSSNLRPETRDKVLRAIEQLGYRPNTSARALVRGRTQIIGVIRMAAAFFGPISTQQSVEEAAREAGLFVSSVAVLDFTRQALADAIEHLIGTGVVGIVVITGHDAALDAVRTRATNVPVVIVEGDLSSAQFTVGIDQEAGSAAATQHLIDLGHRNIAMVGGPRDWAESRARRDGWRETLLAAGLQSGDYLEGDWTAASGYVAGQQLAARAELTAVVCANDQMALGVLRAMSEAGRQVPADVSVVGFDDIPEAGFLVPPLSTVRQDFDAAGRRAVQLLRDAIDGHTIDQSPLIPAQFISRASSGPAPRRAGPAPSKAAE